jgi:hypothetical protein
MWNLVLGPIIGLAGSGITKWLDQKAEAQKFTHELALRKADAELMAQEWAQRTKVAEVEAAGRVEVADSEAFGEAVKSEAIRYSAGVRANGKQAWLLFLLDFLRGIVRPGLTIYLCVIATMLYLDAAEVLKFQPIDPVKAQAQVELIQDKLLMMTEAVVMFWFGMRTKVGK